MQIIQQNDVFSSVPITRDFMELIKQISANLSALQILTVIMIQGYAMMYASSVPQQA